MPLSETFHGNQSKIAEYKIISFKTRYDSEHDMPMQINTAVNCVENWVQNSLYFIGLLSILRAFAKLQTATISFVMSAILSVCMSVRMKQLGSHWKDINKILYLRIFQKIVEKIEVYLKSDKNNEYVT
jgi:hypothetical protein